MTINQPANLNKKKKKLITNRIFVSVKQNCIDTNKKKKKKKKKTQTINSYFILICISFKGGKLHLKPPNREACWIVFGGRIPMCVNRL